MDHPTRCRDYPRSICREAGISQATYLNWKKKYAGLPPSEMGLLDELGDENSRLEKIVADLTFRREMLKDDITKSAAGHKKPS